MIHEDRIQGQLETLEWQIEDARKDIRKTAEALMARAREADEATMALVNNAPTTLGWVDFLEGDIRRAREARERHERLIETKKLLTHLMG